MLDTYCDRKKSVERLLKEYENHNTLIVACDFDETLFDCHNLGHTYDQVINLLKECNKLSLRIVIFTASPEKRFPFIKRYVNSLGIEIEAINENIITLPYGETRKLYYNIFLDDRAGLLEAYETLLEVITIIKLNKLDEPN